MGRGGVAVGWGVESSILLESTLELDKSKIRS